MQYPRESHRSGVENLYKTAAAATVASLDDMDETFHKRMDRCTHCCTGAQRATTMCFPNRAAYRPRSTTAATRCQQKNKNGGREPRENYAHRATWKRNRKRRRWAFPVAAPSQTRTYIRADIYRSSFAISSYRWWTEFMQRAARRTDLLVRIYFYRNMCVTANVCDPARSRHPMTDKKKRSEP